VSLVYSKEHEEGASGLRVPAELATSISSKGWLTRLALDIFVLVNLA
jgi:hypothetical protein